MTDGRRPPATRLAGTPRGRLDRHARAKNRCGRGFAITADARRADGRRRDRERGSRGRGCLPAARPRDGCGGTATGPSRRDEERGGASRPIRRLRGRGRGDEARGGGEEQSPADEAAVGTVVADVAVNEAVGGGWDGGETARRGRHSVEVREERRLRGQGRGTAVQDAPVHKAAATGEERGEGGGLAPPNTSPRDSRGRDVALRGRKPRGCSWGTSPWRRSRGGGGGRERAAAGRGTRQGARAVACGRGRREARRRGQRRRGGRKVGESARRERGCVDGRHRRAFANKAAEPPSRTTSRTRPWWRGRRECAPPDARPHNIRRLGRRPLSLRGRRPRGRSRGTLSQKSSSGKGR